MKCLFIVFGICFFIQNAFAEEKAKYNFKCVNKSPTTSFLLSTEGNEVVLTTVHHNGPSYMPIHEGIIVPNDIPYLSEVARHLMKMGERNTFRFPIKNCIVTGPGLLSCHGGNRLNFNGTEIEALRLVTSKGSEHSPYVSYEYNRVTLSVNVTGFAPVQDLSILYFENECKFDF